jgi:Ca-activated chloride channel homolog
LDFAGARRDEADMYFGNGTGLIYMAVLAALGAAWLVSRFWRKPVSLGRASWGELLLRAAMIVLLCLVVCEPYLEVEHKTSKAVALVDISDSMDEAVGEELLGRARRFASAQLELEFMPFAKESAAFGAGVRGAATLRGLKRSWSKLDIGATNIEQALQAASRLGTASVLLISDGYETAGDLARSAALLKGGGVKVFPLVPEGARAEPSAFRVSHLYAPLVAPAKKSVDIRVSVLNSTQTPQRGLLKVTHDQSVVLEQEVTVSPGSEALVAAASDSLQEGIKEVTARLQPLERSISPSEETVYIAGEEREKVLLLSGAVEDERYLKAALQNQAYQLDAVVSAGRRLEKALDLKKYSCVIFNNIPMEELPTGAASELEAYVGGGGGFMMLGGNRSFGLGGYKNTSVEDVLPVKLLPPQKIQKKLNVAVALVLDKSASMKMENKIEYTKLAAKEVIKRLGDEDYVGIVGFDQQPFHLVEMGQLSRIRAKALDRVDLLYGNLTTRLMPALNLAKGELERAPAGRKHMIIVTDGKLPDAYEDGSYYLQMVREMRMLGITVSSFLIGMEGEPLLKEMAEVGGGAFYRTRDAHSLPRLFLQDVRVNVGENTQKEDASYDVVQGDGRIESTELKVFPPVLGYVETTKKDDANLELAAFANRKAEPLLASWKYGKGRAAAFTSDVSGRWSHHWAGWSKFYKFWTDMLESLRGERGGGPEKVPFELRYFVQKGVLMLDLSLYSETGGALKAALNRPDGAAQELNFTALSRGHYQARLENALAGRYELRASAGSASLTPVAFHISGELFGEKKGKGFARSVLESLAGATGGKINPEPADLAGHAATWTEKKDLSPLLLALVLVLLCIEILRREVFRFKMQRLAGFWRKKRPPLYT